MGQRYKKNVIARSVATWQSISGLLAVASHPFALAAGPLRWREVGQV